MGTDWLKTKSRLLNFDYGIICNLQTESINITNPTKMKTESIIVFTFLVTFSQGLPQNTPNVSVTKTTTIASNDPVVVNTPATTKKIVEIPTTTTSKTEIRIQTLPNDDPIVKAPKVKNPANSRKNGKKDLDNPSKIIDIHKTDDKSHEVSGRKGADSQDIVTEVSTNDHVEDLNNLKVTNPPPVVTTTTTVAPIITTKIPRIKTTTVAKSSSPSPVPKVEKPSQVIVAEKQEPVVNDTTPRTSLLVGIVFGCLLLSVLMFVGFKRLDAIRRRREYRRMNDFLTDGMYNEIFQSYINDIRKKALIAFNFKTKVGF